MAVIKLKELLEMIDGKNEQIRRLRKALMQISDRCDPDGNFTGHIYDICAKALSEEPKEKSDG